MRNLNLFLIRSSKKSGPVSIGQDKKKKTLRFRPPWYQPSLQIGSDQLIMALYSLYIYLSLCTQTADPNHFGGTLGIKLILLALLAVVIC